MNHFKQNASVLQDRLLLRHRKHNLAVCSVATIQGSVVAVDAVDTTALGRKNMTAVEIVAERVD